jgi:hypothetical protein
MNKVKIKFFIIRFFIYRDFALIFNRQVQCKKVACVMPIKDEVMYEIVANDHFNAGKLVSIVDFAH